MLTIATILVAWWLITHLGLVKPLFVPSPELVIAKFAKIACTSHYFEQLQVLLGMRAEVQSECEGFSEHALHEHTLWSLYRVFSSFFLAGITAVPDRSPRAAVRKGPCADPTSRRRPALTGGHVDRAADVAAPLPPNMVENSVPTKLRPDPAV